MLPFCGYHMGDYFKHWIGMEQKTGTDKLPKIFFVNWFRKSPEGKWLWPGYGENSRVLKWVFECCNGEGKTVETPIGIMPTPDAIDRPEGVTEEDMKAMLSVDKEGWQKELLGDRLPQELSDELATLEERLNKA